MTNKHLISILAVALVLSILFVATGSVMASSALSQNKLVSFNEEGVNILSSNDKISEFKDYMRIEGNCLVLYGSKIDKVNLYKNLLKDLKVPMFFNQDEELELKEVLSKHNASSDDKSGIGMKSQTTILALYNVKGKIFVLQEEAVSKDLVMNNSISSNKIKEYAFSNEFSQELEKFKEDMAKLNEESKENLAIAMVTSDTILTSIRKSYDINGTFTSPVGTIFNYKAGKSTTDYIIIQQADSDPSYDYLVVKAHAQVWPAGVAGTTSADNLTLSRGFKSEMNRVSSSDYLLMWSPDSSALSLTNSNQYSFSIGIPATVSFGFTWSGSSSTTLDSTGNKDTGVHSFYIHKSLSAIASNSFTIEHSIMLKSSGTILSVSCKQSFDNMDIHNSGSVWWSQSQSLYYDY